MNLWRASATLDNELNQLCRGYLLLAQDLAKVKQAGLDVDPNNTARDRLDAIIATLKRLPPVFYNTPDGEHPAQHLPEVSRAHQEFVPPLGPGDMLRQAADWIAAATAYLRAVRFFHPDMGEVQRSIDAARSSLGLAIAALARMSEGR